MGETFERMVPEGKTRCSWGGGGCDMIVSGRGSLILKKFQFKGQGGERTVV